MLDWVLRRENMLPMSVRDCLVSLYTVPRKLSGSDNCVGFGVKRWGVEWWECECGAKRWGESGRVNVKRWCKKVGK